MKLQDYLQDGAGTQARCVLMLLQVFNIESSYNKERHRCDATIEVARWENCREQGYIISLINKKGEQINIAFFEHRNSESICALRWLQSSINSITIETAQFNGDAYKDDNKYNVSKSVGYGSFIEMKDWIISELTKHYES